MRPEKLTDKSILCGSPQHIVDTLKQVERAGIAEVILYFNYGRKPHALVKEQMERFMREVAPNFAAHEVSSRAQRAPLPSPPPSDGGGGPNGRRGRPPAAPQRQHSLKRPPRQAISALAT